MSDGQVFREVSFQYKGEKIELVPTIAMLRRIKQAGVNNVELARQFIKGGADTLDIVTVHCAMMEKAGHKISQEESYGWVMGENRFELLDFQTAYVQAVLPGIDFGKKPDARENKEETTENTQT